MPWLMVAGSKFIGVECQEDWDPEWGNSYREFVKFTRGNPDYDPRVLPNFGWFMGKNVQYYPPLMPSPYWICDAAVKDVIEEFEPGIHQFIPFDIRYSKTGEVACNRYIIQVRDNLPAIDIENSEPKAVTINKLKDGSLTISAHKLGLEVNRAKLVIDGTVAGSRNLWLEGRSSQYSEVFVSDALKTHLESVIDMKYITFFRLYENEE